MELSFATFARTADYLKMLIYLPYRFFFSFFSRGTGHKGRACDTYVNIQSR
jgi:hypothetical protein